jgi:hypothetical protein
MIQKFWSDVTHDEKLDVLRNDIERLFAAINTTNSNVSRLDIGMNELFTRLTITQQNKSRQVAQKKQSSSRTGRGSHVKLEEPKRQQGPKR